MAASSSCGVESGRSRHPPCRWDTALHRRPAATVGAVAVVPAACGKSPMRGGEESGTAVKSAEKAASGTLESIAGACRVHRGAEPLQHRLAASELQDCNHCRPHSVAAWGIQASLPPCKSRGYTPCAVVTRIALTHRAVQSVRAGGAPDAGPARGRGSPSTSLGSGVVRNFERGSPEAERTRWCSRIDFPSTWVIVESSIRRIYKNWMLTLRCCWLHVCLARQGPPVPAPRWW